MQLDSIKCFVVGNPNRHLGGRYFIFLRLTTKCGITGYGEIYAASFDPHKMALLAEDVFSRDLAGQDPFQIERNCRRIYHRGYTGRPDVTLGGVISGLEMACWDIIGKALDRPVYNLLGGRFHDRLRSYTYLYPLEGDSEFYADPDRSAEQAARCVAEGFTAIKCDPAGAYTTHDPHQPTLADLARSETFMQRLREAIGDRADILFGTHGQFTPSGAKRMAAMLEPYQPLWFEEPVPPERPDLMAEVARATSIPVAAGERLTGKHEFAQLLQHQAASILQMNLGRVGGLLEAKKIAGMAEAHYAQIAPHLYCGPLVAAANIQLAACSPNFLILESIYKMDGFFADLLHKPLRWEDGYILVPDAPGLGVELNETIAKANPYEGDDLHFGPQEVF